MLSMYKKLSSFKKDLFESHLTSFISSFVEAAFLRRFLFHCYKNADTALGMTLRTLDANS